MKYIWNFSGFDVNDLNYAKEMLKDNKMRKENIKKTTILVCHGDLSDHDLYTTMQKYTAKHLAAYYEWCKRNG